jgi:hypothetical protein
MDDVDPEVDESDREILAHARIIKKAIDGMDHELTDRMLPTILPTCRPATAAEFLPLWEEMQDRVEVFQTSVALVVQRLRERAAKRE